jgi:hypothetical protein
VSANNYQEEDIRSLKWMVTPKHKGITSNKLETTTILLLWWWAKNTIASINQWIKLGLQYYYPRVSL